MFHVSLLLHSPQFYLLFLCFEIVSDLLISAHYKRIINCDNLKPDLKKKGLADLYKKKKICSELSDKKNAHFDILYVDLCSIYLCTRGMDHHISNNVCYIFYLCVCGHIF